MPRTGPSRTDAALIAAAAQRGVRVSPYQLERWRASGALPRNHRHGAGRGRGSVSHPTPDAVERVVVLGGQARQGRPADLSPLFLAAGRGDEDQVRGQVRRQLHRLQARLGGDLGDSDAAIETRYGRAEAIARRAGSRLLDGQELVDALLEVLGDEHAAPQPLWSGAPLRGRIAQLQLLAGDAQDVAIEDLTEAFAAQHPAGISADALHAARIRDELTAARDWRQLLEGVSTHRALELVDTVAGQPLCRGVLACHLAPSAMWMFLFTVVFHPSGAALLREVTTDPMWGVFRLLPLPRRGRNAAQLAALYGPNLAAAPWLLAAVEQYTDRLMQLVQQIVLGGYLPSE